MIGVLITAIIVGGVLVAISLVSTLMYLDGQRDREEREQERVHDRERELIAQANRLETRNGEDGYGHQT
jgi:hypothetical protein